MTVTLLLACLLTITPTSADEGHDSSSHPPAFIDCGTSALYHLLRVEGVTADLDRLESVLGPATSSGHSLAELRTAAYRLGLTLDAALISKAHGSIDRPLIAFVKRGTEGHYILVRPVGHTGQLVQVLEGESEPSVIDEDQLLALPGWTGIALAPRRRGVLRLLATLGGICLSCAALLRLAVVTKTRRKAKRDAQASRTV